MKVKDKKFWDEICAKLLSEWLGKESPGSCWADDDVSMQDFSLSYRDIYSSTIKIAMVISQ